jgi:acyl carrier protein
MDLKDVRLRTAGEVLQAALKVQGEHCSKSGSSGTGVCTPSPQGADQIEDLLATIVAGALGVVRVRRDLGFSALGGDSLMATRVLSRVWRAFDVKLPLSALAPDVSVSMLTTAVKHARDAGGSTELPLGRQTARGAEELSPNQAAIWFVESLDRSGALYNIPYGLRLRGPLEAAALRSSLNRLVRNNEALRLRFELREGRLLQEPCTVQQSLELPIVDLSEMPQAASEIRALSLAEEHVRIPFDLARPPLLRALLIRLSREDHMLVLVIHHIVCDAWSIKLMMGQLSKAYSELAVDASHGLTPGFLDFVAWQRKMLDDAEVTRLVSGWREALGDFSKIPLLPTDYARHESTGSSGGATELVELSPELIGDLRKLSGDHGVTLYMTLLGAFAILISHHAGSDSVIIGSPVANRGQESLERIVGYLANMLPMRVDCGGDPTVRELLGRVRAVALAAYDRQALPFAQLVGELSPPRRLGLNPVFQVALILNDMSAPPLGETQVSEVLLHTGTAKLDLTCYLEEQNGGLSGYLEYPAELFASQTIECLRLDFERTLSQIADYVDQPLSEIMARTLRSHGVMLEHD